VAVGEVWHVHHEGNEVKIVCSDTLRWNGYSQDHASGGREGDMVIQPDQESAVNVTSKPENMWERVEQC
jgi:hypothetical protein